MILIKTNEKEKLTQYVNLFGGIKLAIDAENLFYYKMKQMISVYIGGYFDYFIPFDSDTELEKSTFIPILLGDNVVVTSPFGVSVEVSYPAASLVVWVFVLTQIAEQENCLIQSRIYNVIEDIKLIYSTATTLQDALFFNEEDRTGIWKILD